MRVGTFSPFLWIWILSASTASADTLWTYTDDQSTAISASLSNQAADGWVGGTAQPSAAYIRGFDIPGDGSPTSDLPSSDQSAHVEARSAREADLVVSLKGMAVDSGPFVMDAFTSAFGLIWSYTFASTFDHPAVHRSVAISRGGEVVCVLLQATVRTAGLVVLDGSGNLLRSIVFQDHTYNLADDVSTTDDGSYCLVIVAGDSKVIDTSSGEVVFSSGIGGNGVGQISGDGQRFIWAWQSSIRIFEKVNGEYTSDFIYNDPNAWNFGAATLSRDGSTFAMANNENELFRRTVTRIFDFSSHSVLGTYSTEVAGQYQDRTSSLAMSNDGSTIAVGYWGGQFHEHDEVIVMDQSASELGSVGLPGSVYGLDLSDDGVYVLIASKETHANVVIPSAFDVTLFQVR